MVIAEYSVYIKVIKKYLLTDVVENAQNGGTGNKNTNMRDTRDDTETPYSH